jgi:hypothetical protein
LDSPAKSDPVIVVATIEGHKVEEDGICVGADGQGDAWMALGEFGGIRIDLYDIAGGYELLPVESGLLQTEPATEYGKNVCLLHEDIGVALAPSIRAAEIEWVSRVDAVGTVPSCHDRDAKFGERLSNLQRGLVIDTATDEDCGTLGGLQALGDLDGEVRLGAGRLAAEDGSVHGGGIEFPGLEVEGDFEEYRTFADAGGLIDELKEPGVVNDIFKADRANGDGPYDGRAIDFLDSALAELAVGEVGDLHLSADDEEFTAFEERAAERGNDVGKAGTGGDQRQSLAIGVDLVEVLRRNSSGYFMNDRDGGQVAAATLEQVHDVAASNEETVGVTGFGQPLGQ